MKRFDGIFLFAACLATACFVLSLSIRPGRAACDPEPEEDIRIWFESSMPELSAGAQGSLEELECELSRFDSSPDIRFSCREGAGLSSTVVVEGNLLRVER